MLRSDPQAERGDELDQDAGWGVRDRARGAAGKPGCGYPEDHAAEQGPDDGRGEPPADRKTASRRHDREPVDQQRAAVVEQALTFQDRTNPIRNRHGAEHSGGGCGVRGRDNGAERNGHGPAHGGLEPVRRHGDGDHGHGHGSQRQERDRRDVALEVAGRRVKRRVEQDRRHEQREHQLGVEPEIRSERHEGDRRSAEGEERREGRLEPACHQRQQDGAEKDRQDRHEGMHGRLTPDAPFRSAALCFVCDQAADRVRRRALRASMRVQTRS